MEIDRKELKLRAREAMAQTRPRFWAVTLVYLLMTTGVSLVLDVLPLSEDAPSGFPMISIFLTILFTLYSLVVDFGYNLWSLWTNRRLDPGLGSLIQGFSVAGRVILMELYIYLRVLGWGICIALISIIPMFMAVSVPGLILPIAAAIYAAIWAIMLRYALAPYLLADHPDDGAGAAVRRSADLMRGWKWELFKLEFSFLGWILASMALSAVATALALWISGFFRAAAAYPPTQLPGLVQNFFLWQYGISFEAFPADQTQLFQLYFNASNGTLAVLLSNLITLPLFLWLTPYRSVARAEFYEARLQLQREAPEMPPL